jgi:hypothetical protein
VPGKRHLSLVQVIYKSQREVRRQAERNKKKPRYAAHGRDIAQINRKGFFAQAQGVGEPQVEVNVFDQKIAGREKKLMLGQPERSRVITYAACNGRISGPIGSSYALNEPGFA